MELLNLQQNSLMLLKSLFVSFFLCFSISYQNSEIKKIEPEKLYKNNCRLCHGSKGKLGIGGASDLSKSKLNISQTFNIISKGQGTMTGFENILTPKEIKALAKYIQQFKK